jgi:hypothetical protein
VGIVDARGAQHGLISRQIGTGRPTFDWGHDGSRILLARVCPERGKRLQIYSLDPKLKDQPQLLPAQDAERMNSGVAISPDGTKLAICSHRPPANKAPEK